MKVSTPNSPDRLHEIRWNYIKSRINSFPFGFIFHINDIMLNNDFYKSRNTKFTYEILLSQLSQLSILQSSTINHYQKICKFKLPKTLTYNQFYKILTDKSWKSWFIPIEERLKRGESQPQDTHAPGPRRRYLF